MKLFAIMITFLLFCISCNNTNQDDNPTCIDVLIHNIQKGEVWNPPAEVYTYTYKGETVYYFSARCCDIMSDLYDEKCNLICHPDGGITGNGNGLCPDFFEERSNGKLYWKDER